MVSPGVEQAGLVADDDRAAHDEAMIAPFGFAEFAHAVVGIVGDRNPAGLVNVGDGAFFRTKRYCSRAASYLRVKTRTTAFK